jgi:hypothetical protein
VKRAARWTAVGLAIVVVAPLPTFLVAGNLWWRYRVHKAAANR